MGHVPKQAPLYSSITGPSNADRVVNLVDEHEAIKMERIMMKALGVNFSGLVGIICRSDSKFAK